MNIFHKVLELWLGHESGTYGRTDGRTDGRTGRTGVTLNALPLFFEYAGALKDAGPKAPGSMLLGSAVHY